MLVAQLHAMYEVTAVKIYLTKTVLCNTLVIGNLNLTSVTNIYRFTDPYYRFHLKNGGLDLMFIIEIMGID